MAVIFMSLVWLVNGIFGKVLHVMPRHREIVGKILGDTFATEITIIIGVGEVILALWIFSRYLPRLSAITQIILVGTMNIIEFILVPDLLLWGKFNAMFAAIYILFVYAVELYHPQNLQEK